jgi:hypothetical protein
MSSQVSVFWGNEPSEPSERQFLDRLVADLRARNVQAVVLANFFVGKRQIDFLVVTPSHVCHVELKNWAGILIGGENGPWSRRHPDGTLEAIGQNSPYGQANDCRMVISNAMRSLAGSDASVPGPSNKDFFRDFDSAICIFPEVRPGSQLPSDFRVKTIGYADLIAFIVAPGKHPTWQQRHWEAFIRIVGLTPTHARADEAASQEQAAEILQAYANHFREYYATKLHELVQLPLRADDELVEDLESAVRSLPYLQLIAESGSGKSHLAAHAALALVADGWLVIPIKPLRYDKRLSQLLDQGVALFSNSKWTDLMQSAARLGRRTLVLVDGFNECPEPLQNSLSDDLLAFARTNPAAQLLTTSQSEVRLPQPLLGRRITIDTLTEVDRRALLESYGTADIYDHCEAFTTAYELSIAAECAGELLPGVSPGSLFAAYVRKRLRNNQHVSVVRDALRHLALVMDERLVSAVPLDGALRLLEEHLIDSGLPLAAADEALSCSLVDTQFGQVTFRHELVGRFLLVEGLRHAFRQTGNLVLELKKPRHSGLGRIAVELESREESCQQLLAGAAEFDLYAAAHVGELGAVARRVASRELERAITERTSRMDSMIFFPNENYELKVVNPVPLTEQDSALLATAGALATDERVLGLALTFLDAVDMACHRSVATVQGLTGKGPSPSALVATIYQGFAGGSMEVGASTLLKACEQQRWSGGFKVAKALPWPTLEQMLQIADGLDAQAYGRLLFLCHLLHQRPRLETAALAIRVLRLSWDSDAYHLQLVALHMIQSFSLATEGAAIRANIIATLEAFEATHWGTSSTLIEALFSYGQIEPPGDSDSVAKQIRMVLSEPLTPELGSLAYGIVSSLFEDVIAQPYYEAVEALTEGEKMQLYAAGALHARTYAAWTGWLLRELVKAHSSHGLQAFRRWSSELQLDSVMRQEVGSVYATAVEGYALFAAEPPQLAGAGESADLKAWQCYGEIIFWMHRPWLDETKVRARCEPVWSRLQSKELRAAAVDPLHWLNQWDMGQAGNSSTYAHQVSGTFPAQVRSICEWSFANRQSLTTVFPQSWTFPSQNDFIVDMLGHYGGAETIDLLRPHADDSKIGGSVVSAVRQLRERLRAG